jgi:glyoxylase-like metal-dependent hydrolase (beta-lactamase superfamily II)
MSSTTRRDFLRSTAACAAGAALLDLPIAALAKSAPIGVTPLRGGVQLVTGGAANVLAYGGPGGLVLVDGGPKAQAGAILSAALKATGTKRLDTLFNTHWHPEQTGLNEQAGKSAARIVAQENTKLWLKRRIVTDWLPPKGYGPLPSPAIPNKSFYSTEAETIGSEEVAYGHLGQAHTDGDLYVHFRKANVLAAGGVVSTAGWPLLDWQTGGWIGGLVGAHDRLIKASDDATLIVPANGPVLDRKALKAQREMYMSIFDQLVKSLTKGLGPEEAHAAGPAKAYEAQMGDSKAFVVAAFKSLWGHFAPDA